MKKELGKIVNYQEKGVVSKEIIRSNCGTITVFAFDKGQGLSPHSAPFDAFVYIIEGKAKIVIEDKEYLLESGDYIIMPKDIPHSLFAQEQFKMLLVMQKG